MEEQQLELPFPREDALAEAERLINGPRKNDYGGHTFREIADMWSVYLRRRGSAQQLSERDVCAMMALLKIARLSATPSHRDSMVDCIGYMALYEKVKP